MAALSSEDGSSSAAAAAPEPEAEESEFAGEKLAPFNPSMPYVVDAALAMLQLSGEDVLYDLGCGDGRVMVAAAQPRS